MIATLYDIHGNLAALEAVLAEIPDRELKADSGLTEEQLAFLYGLPATQQVGRVLYVHASPRNDMDIFTELTPEDRIAFLFADLDADVVVCGHTHVQFERTIAGKRVINSGSVGSPFEEQPGAYWTLDLEHRRTAYEGAPEPEHSRGDALSHLTEIGL